MTDKGIAVATGAAMGAQVLMNVPFADLGVRDAARAVTEGSALALFFALLWLNRRLFNQHLDMFVLMASWGGCAMAGTVLSQPECHTAAGAGSFAYMSLSMGLVGAFPSYLWSRCLKELRPIRRVAVLTADIVAMSAAMWLMHHLATARSASALFQHWAMLLAMMTAMLCTTALRAGLLELRRRAVHFRNSTYEL